MGQPSYNSIVHDHLCDTWLPTFETLAYWLCTKTDSAEILAPTRLALFGIHEVVTLKYSNRYNPGANKCAEVKLITLINLT